MLEVRPTRDRSDEQASLDVYNRVWPWDAVSLDEVDAFKRLALDYGDFLALLDGEPAGSLAIALMPARPNIGFALLTVLPEHRRRGAGSALYEAASVWLAERRIEEVDSEAPEDDAYSIAWAGRRGFREIQRDSRLVLDLTDYDPPPVAPPRGIEIVRWSDRPDLAEGVYEVACEAMPDVPGQHDRLMEPFDSWLEHHLGTKAPEATFVALADADVVGYAKLGLTTARPREATHHMTGVKRAWRGRGIAGALKRAQIAWAKSAGYERLQTQNEVRNEPIRRLNERLGYRLAPGRVFVRGPLSRR